jgi:hypothetical protein
MSEQPIEPMRDFNAPRRRASAGLAWPVIAGAAVLTLIVGEGAAWVMLSTDTGPLAKLIPGETLRMTLGAVLLLGATVLIWLGATRKKGVRVIY